MFLLEYRTLSWWYWLASLLPWNRAEPFSADLLRRTFFSRPVRGDILQGLPPAG